MNVVVAHLSYDQEAKQIFLSDYIQEHLIIYNRVGLHTRVSYYMYKSIGLYV